MSRDQANARVDIAIIGMAGRFPGAPSIEAFWENVKNGVESIRTLDDEALIAAGVPRSKLSSASYVKACPVLEDVDKFDASFFGFSPRDASVMDPAQRFFLEVAFHAVEHAGYTALPSEGPVGVFAGTGAPLYLQENLRANADLMRSMGEFLVRHTGNDMNFMATRVSYELDLRGPSMNVQTACSSALVSVHMACQSLARGECTLALAGGSTILVPMGHGYEYHEGEILSPDGHCRPFDAKSAGTVFGSGTGCVVLKRLSDALDDGDTIHAVIKGSAINNDGSLKVGYLAPSVDGQADVIDAALKVADVSADSIGYVEAHGTGTSVGDPIEVEGLRQAFARHTGRLQFCALGSVKSNIGHLGEAAGIASLIKAVLALKHKQLPPSLGYESPNPQIDFPSTPFFVNSKLTDWRSTGPRRVGVTALGAGGTNCHVILEEAPEPIEGEGARTQQLIVLSAKTKSALDRAAENLAAQLESSEVDLADVAYTLSLGRRPMPQRRVLVAASAREAADKLRRKDPKQVVSGHAEGTPAAVFLFPGGGAQYAGMGAELYEHEQTYRDALDECLALIEPGLGLDLRGLMFAPPSEREQATRCLERPSLTLPSLFATEYALAKLFLSWGLEPVAYVGHSMGEYVAACLSGVVSLADAIKLVMLRGKLFEQVDPGGMLSVSLPESEVRALMPSGLSIAAVNGPSLCVASGPRRALDAFEETLTQRGVDTTRVRIDVAAHSAMLDPILERFRALCRTISFQPPRVPFVSNLTGRWITPAEATSPEYWVKHLRSPVRFAECLETVLAAGERVLIEVGPGRTLSTLARAQATPVRHAFNVMRHPQEPASDLGYALTALGRAFVAGVELDWSALYDGQLRNRIPLPTYPFEGKSFWVEPALTARETRASELEKRASLDDWFTAPTFTQVPRITPARASESASGELRWLVFSDGSGLADRLVGRLPGSVMLATQGVNVIEREPGHWALDMTSSNQHLELLDVLGERGFRPDHVVYVTGASLRARVHTPSLEDTPDELMKSFYVPTYLARALGRLGEPISLSVVTRGLARVGKEPITPLRATSLGPVLVAPREFPQLHTRCIDVGPRGIGADAQDVEDALLDELTAARDDRVVLLRPGARWVQTLMKLDLPPTTEAADAAPLVREGGVYVLTGGLGGIALELAAHFAKKARVKLALFARSELPPEDEWDTLLKHAHAGSLGAQRIQKVRALQALGADVRIYACDVSEREETARALARVRRELGPVRGLVHTAGVMDDEPMESRTNVAMERVLAPKVTGTIVLDELIHERLDFFVLFSSVASTLGLPGQVDYTAANAFLDAFAHERAQRAQGRTVVIDWNAWRDVGMAALSQQVQKRGRLPSSPCAHPALDGYSDERGSGRTFTTDFEIARHWLLSEHTIKGAAALLSGTTFVELARAAFAVGKERAPIEIADLTFLSPFQVGPSETRRLIITLTPAGDATEVAMRTAGADPRALPHAIGDVRTYEGPRPAPLDLTAIAARCRLREELPKDGFLAQSFVDFGPRWANLKRTRYGYGEALIELSLPERFAADLEHFALHPALLDMATGGAQALIPGFSPHADFYVPVGYGRVRIFAPLARKLFSHVRCRPASGPGHAYFDVTLSDADGTTLVEIERFEMKRLESGSALTAAPSASHVARRPESALDLLLREAIAPDEGVLAFDRVLAQPELVQCIASSVDVSVWANQLAALASERNVGSAGAGAQVPGGFARPDLSSEYEAPASASEELLAGVWSELLGIRQVGVRDDFFELGGNSLLAVRLFAAIKKHYGVSLPLSTLFEAPSIRPLAELLDANAPVKVESAQVGDAAQGEGTAPARGTSYSSLVPMQLHGDRPPFYCAAGMGGNPLNLRALAQLVGIDQPFYGLQPQGLDGQSQLHASVPEMASYYLTQIRAHQPHGPYYLGGYSGGGVIAYEMAKQLVDAGEEVGALVFLDSIAPVLPQRSRRERLELHLERLKARGASYVVDTAKKRAESELRDVTMRLRRPIAKLFPYHFRLENIADTWLEAQAAYKPTPYAGCAMLYRASVASALVSGTAMQLGAYNGWEPYVLGGIEVSACPGDHNSLCEEPNVRVLARRLRAYLDRSIMAHAARVEAPAAAPPTSNVVPSANARRNGSSYAA